MNRSLRVVLMFIFVFILLRRLGCVRHFLQASGAGSGVWSQTEMGKKCFYIGRHMSAHTQCAVICAVSVSCDYHLRSLMLLYSNALVNRAFWKARFRCTTFVPQCFMLPLAVTSATSGAWWRTEIWNSAARGAEGNQILHWIHWITFKSKLSVRAGPQRHIPQGCTQQNVTVSLKLAETQMTKLTKMQLISATRPQRPLAGSGRWSRGNQARLQANWTSTL